MRSGLRRARIGWDQNDDLDSAFQGVLKCDGDWWHRNGLVLDIDCLAGRADRLHILIEDRSLTAGDVVGRGLRARMSIAIALRVHVALDLYESLAARRRKAKGKG